MASTHASLDAAAAERKARLAKLASLKRKRPSSPESSTNTLYPPESTTESAPSEDTPSVTTTYLSGRNYDPLTRGPKLGFEVAPSANAETLEDRSNVIAEETRRKAEEEEKEEKPIDLFKLQPKRPNWDLKRDMARKMERLNVQTENAIAGLVRERIEGAKRKQVEANGGGPDGGENVGMQGVELVEGVRVREREEEEDEKREREEEALV